MLRVRHRPVTRCDVAERRLGSLGQVRRPGPHCGDAVLTSHVGAAGTVNAEQRSHRLVHPADAAVRPDEGETDRRLLEQTR
jgi:hypothetical protein